MLNTSMKKTGSNNLKKLLHADYTIIKTTHEQRCGMNYIPTANNEKYIVEEMS